MNFYFSLLLFILLHLFLYLYLFRRQVTFRVEPDDASRLRYEQITATLEAARSEEGDEATQVRGRR